MSQIKQIPRNVLVNFIKNQMKTDKPEGTRNHYGYQELRQLLDLLYGSPPEQLEEQLVSKYPMTKILR